MLTSIKATNLKGSSFEYELAPLTVFVGDNRSSKTAVLDAIWLALLGYHPRLGKMPNAILKLSDGNHMEVCAQSPSGEIVREWGTTDESRQVQLPELPAIMLDSKLYFELSTQKRVRMVASLVDNPSISSASVRAKIKNIKLEENSEGSEHAIEKILGLLAGDGTTLGDWLEWDIDLVEKLLSNCRASKKRMVGVVTGIEQLRAKDENEVRVSDDIGGQLRDARKRREELLATINNNSTTIKIARLKHQIALDNNSAKNVLRELESATEHLYDLEKALERITKSDCCPTCGADETGWQKKWVKKQQALIDEERDGVKHVKKQAKKLETDIKANQSLLDKSEKELQSQAKSTVEEMNKLTEQTGELENKQKQLIASRSDTKRQMEASAESQRLDVEIQVLTQTLKILKAEQATQVETAFGSLLQVVNRFTKAVIDEPVEYRNNELGYDRKGSWVSHSCFSGAEETVLCAGLCAALAAKSNFKICVIDEVSKLDRKSKRNLMLELWNAIGAGVIHQAILSDWDEEAFQLWKTPSPDSLRKAKVIVC